MHNTDCTTWRLPSEVKDLLANCAGYLIPRSRLELISLAMGGGGTDLFEVAYDVPGTGASAAITLPAGLRESEKLPQSIYTPSTKAEAGAHDENISFENSAELLGPKLAEKVCTVSLELYTFTAEYARKRGIIIADTKFEFRLIDGELVLIDELFTPDSSRFWPVDGYQPGKAQVSFDKQYVRDYLETLNWDKRPPAPELADKIVNKTAERYLQALRMITGRQL